MMFFKRYFSWFDVTNFIVRDTHKLISLHAVEEKYNKKKLELEKKFCHSQKLNMI